MFFFEIFEKIHLTSFFISVKVSTKSAPFVESKQTKFFSVCYLTSDYWRGYSARIQKLQVAMMFYHIFYIFNKN